ncbi:MAG: class I SAM-dependent methyltransferase [Ignavibacteriales bacterium]
MRIYKKPDYSFNDGDLISVIDELPLWSAPFGLKLLDSIVLKKNMTVLDIGSGFGFPSIEVACRLGRCSKVYGIDPWEAAIKRAQKKIDIFKIPNVELILGEAESIPLPDSSVDLIISNNGLNNVQQPDKVFQECSRVAKTGAQFVATYNLSETMKEFYQIFRQVLADHDLNEIIPLLQMHIDRKRPPMAEYEKLFSENNFEICQVEADSFKYRFVDGTAMFDYPFIQYAFMDSWLSLVPEDRVTEVFTEIESRMNNESSKNGEWSLTIPFAIFNAFKK